MSARYRLRRRLGRGGMAEVFEATAMGERGFERRVAVKRMLPEIGRIHDDGFLDEARIASTLHHANIVAVLDYGIADGLPFQVLELVDGIDLQSALALGRPLPPELVLHVCTEVAYALSHAHEARAPDGQPLGIVHRDVKPANILVSYDGDVKLGDFGIALARDRLQRTEVGIAKGTREFMSPEQWVAGEVDARSDVFSLGCVLYALLTGDSPMGRTRAEELLEGQELTFDKPLPEDVASIVARATRRQKRERYPTAAAMAEALSAALQKRVQEAPKALLQKWMRELKPLADAQPKELVEAELALDENEGKKQLRTQVGKARRSRWWMTAAAAALVAGGGIVASWPRAKVSIINNGAPVSSADRTHAVVTAAPPQPSLAPVSDPPRVAAKPKSRPHPPTTALRASAPVPPPPVPISAATGHFLVGGEGALRAEIWIDGRSRGFAPKLLELPAGPHEVELLLGTGSRLRRQITLAESHTPSSPLRWLVP
ncbi:MAG TPA: serine/threonine-protein kinase [Polyangia bacterium]|jgi:serine/threonine-protein kinase